MLAQTISPLPSTSNALRSNFMDALIQSPAAFEVRSSSPKGPDALSSPESSSASVGFIEMSDLMLPASALEVELFGVPQDSNATVVSTASSYDEIPRAVITTAARSRPSKNKKLKLKRKSASERRHSIPSNLMLSPDSPLNEAVTQPIPEFLCHLFSMLRDPSYADLISWSVPTHDEPDHMGGGIHGIGKIVVHKPESIQDSVLGKYYRHSKYASFQRQLNYFGFKKRLHGGKKGKLSPCSYIHESLTEDVRSLFGLKRRPPAKKRMMSEEVKCDKDCSSSISSHEDTEACSPISNKPNKKRRVTVDKKPPKKINKKNRSKKDKKKQQCIKQEVVDSSIPHQVQVEEYGPPSPQSSVSIEHNQYQVQPITITSTATPDSQVSQPPSIAPKNQPTPTTTTSSTPQAPQPTLLDLLSTSLPPSEILFDDSIDGNSMDDEGMPAWITDDGKYHYHNVDSSLIDLAMLY